MQALSYYIQDRLSKAWFPLLVLLTAVVSILTHEWRCILIPLGVLFVWLSIQYIPWIYFLLLIVIPFSTEMELPGGFSTDFPDEPLMWWLFGLGMVYLVMNPEKIRSMIKHPLTLVLFFHWTWIFLVSLSSQDVMVSVKYWASKSWYLFVFYFLAFIILKNEKRWMQFVWCSILSATVTVLIIEYRHALTGFSFSAINTLVNPFYRNHVNYACLLACIFPYLWPAWKKFEQKPIFRMGLGGIAVTLLAGIIFSYTRAAYLALFSILIIYPILKFKLLRITAMITVVASIVVLIYFLSANRYLELAPDYNQAISHTDFGSLLQATPKGKDISTMERLYRWVAGTRMVGERYFVGFGPGNFHNFYDSYTLKQFATYVSENKDRSGIHNYYLMTAVEQGIPGLLLFLVVLYFYFQTAQNVLTRISLRLRPWAIASIWSMGVILSILLFNDMIETDKVGSYFFINMAILVRLNRMTDQD